MIGSLTMNRIALVLSLVLVAGCASNPGPVFIDSIGQPDKDCSVPSDVKIFVTRGSLDLAGWVELGHGAQAFPMVIQLSGWSDVVVPAQTSSTMTVGTMEGTQHRLVIDSLRLSYKASKGSPLGAKVKATCPPATGGDGSFLDCDVQPVAAEAKASSLVIGDSLIGKNMRDRLVDLANTNTTIDPFTLYVTLELTGKQYPTGNQVTTGPTVFPITVWRTACAGAALNAPDLTGCGTHGVNSGAACTPP